MHLRICNLDFGDVSSVLSSLIVLAIMIIFMFC